ncbi:MULTISPECIES: glutathione peroxidase [unclassified Beijerinckia]|uniref:glutathione peroxidase n=1 Tax=unclassified Beijerinckia TaxID=2638183 RepID=UPI00089CC605|nr:MULTISPECIES: glutathione peroxidase [unclassified Beijerinckia]MDH7799281.1 glutathione peroxidase [Beijerinckia sp. GAS462]SED44727.1 glutathione peroxidase [Beijerinckia sp. 28-YEA-48]
MTSIYDFSARTLAGADVSIADYRDKVLLIVNTASKCGFTPQYEGLETLYRDLRERGLVVLGFPCNQFGAQEPGDADEIASFCKLTYDVDFPMFAKIDVNGPTASPLFEWLKNEAPGLLGSKAIKWNFTKFLVNREGQVVGRFAPTTKPDGMRADIEALL